MATSFALLKKTDAKSHDSLIFETLSGDLTVTTLPQSNTDDNLFLQMNFPLGCPQKQNFEEETIKNLLQSLSLDPSYHPSDIQFCERTKKLLLVFDNVDTILQAKPLVGDLMKVKLLHEKNKTVQVF